MPSPLFFSFGVAYILVQAKLESYLCFLHELLNLTDRNPAWDNTPENEREAGILPAIVSQNNTLSLAKQGVPLETLEASSPEALRLAVQPERSATFAERLFVALAS